MSDTVWSDPKVERIVSLLSARTGLRFRPEQKQGTELGIQRVMKRREITDFADFARRLRYDVNALNELIAELTVGETYFFREPKQFAYIRHRLLPEITQRRGRDHVIRIWCAGSATGEEAYSMAMLCTKEGIQNRTHILATDISERAIVQARDATYREWSLRGEETSTAKEFLNLRNGRYHVQPQITRCVKFEILNLAGNKYPSQATGTAGLDLILCRNVLIYFDRDTVRAVARRLLDSLTEGGWLITASGDPPVNEFADFETVVTDYGVFYRRPLDTGEVKRGPVVDIQNHKVDRRSGVVESTMVPTHTADKIPRPSPVPPADLPTSSAPRPMDDRWHETRMALDDGRYQDVIRLTDGHFADHSACILRLKALANIHTGRAAEQCSLFVERHPLSSDLQYLHAVLLMEMNRDIESVQAAQRAVYLDRSMPAAHFLLGSLLQRSGALAAARRHYRNARDLCQSRPPDELIHLADGETAAHLAEAAASRMAAVEADIRNNM